jgi:hypothetical protein
MADMSSEEVYRELLAAIEELKAAIQAYQPYSATRPLGPGHDLKVLDAGYLPVLRRLQSAETKYARMQRALAKGLRAAHREHGPVDHMS